MIVSISKGTVFFGEHDVFENIDLTIQDNERVALIGRNGCGKTTLLKCLTGEQNLESGEIFRNKNKEIAYLRQHAFADETKTVREEFYDVFKDLIQEEKKLNQMAIELGDNYSEKAIEAYTQRQEAFRLNGGYDYEKEILYGIFNNLYVLNCSSVPSSSTTTVENDNFSSANFNNYANSSINTY